MYKISNYHTGEIIEFTENITWIRMQKNGIEVLCPECTYETADGVRLSDDDTILGIEGRSMNNYTPTVIVEKMSDEYKMIFELQNKVDTMQEQVNAMQAQSTTTGEQINEIYAAQAGDTVVKSELDAAYREGVNSYE